MFAKDDTSIRLSGGKLNNVQKAILGACLYIDKGNNFDFGIFIQTEVLLKVDRRDRITI